MNAAEELVDVDCDCDDCDDCDECDESTEDSDDKSLTSSSSFLTTALTVVTAPFVFIALLPFAGLGLTMQWILNSNEKHQMEVRNNSQQHPAE